MQVGDTLPKEAVHISVTKNLTFVHSSVGYDHAQFHQPIFRTVLLEDGYLEPS